MPNDFEDHCWRDVVSSDVLDLYSRYTREVFVGTSPALLAIDLYELAYEGGARPIAEISKDVSEFLWRACLGCNRTDKTTFCGGALCKNSRFLFHDGCPSKQQTGRAQCDQAAGAAQRR